jgi:hypothetical protein
VNRQKPKKKTTRALDKLCRGPEDLLEWILGALFGSPPTPLRDHNATDSPEGLDLREFFVSRRRWFFGVISVPASVDIVDSLMKNHAAAAEAGYVFLPTIVMALLTRNTKYHAVLATRSLTVPDPAHPPRLHFPSSLRSS